MYRLLALATGLFLPSLAFAVGEEAMATRFGNTVVVQDTLATSRLWFQPDHTFRGSNWLMDVGGTWSVKEGTICLHFDETPPFRSNPECGRLTARQVGDTWEEEGRTYQLLEGVQK